VLNILGRPKNTTAQRQRAWSDFIMAVLEETHSHKLAKELLAEPQLATHVACYLTNPLSVANDEKVAMDVEQDAADRTTPQRRTFPKTFLSRSPMGATHATKHAVFAVAHFRQATVASYIESRLHATLQNAGMTFLRFEKKQASTEYFTVQFNYDIDYANTFDSEVEKLRETLQQQLQWKDFHFDQRSLAQEFFDHRRHRAAPQVLVATGSEPTLSSPFFANRDLQVLVQPARRCFGCGQHYTPAGARHCKACVQAARQRDALQANASGVATTEATVFCFQCCQRVPVSHIGHCKNKSYHCLHCNSRQHHTLKCSLLRKRFAPLSDTTFSPANSKANSVKSSSSSSAQRSTTSYWRPTGRSTQSATAPNTSTLSTPLPQVPAATAPPRSSFAEALTAITTTKQSPPSLQLLDEQLSPSQSLSQPTSAGIDNLRRELRDEWAEQLTALQRQLLEFQQRQTEKDTLLLQEIRQLNAQPRYTAPLATPIAAVQEEAKNPFAVQAELRELKDLVRDLNKTIQSQHKRLDELSAENSKLRQQLTTALETLSQRDKALRSTSTSDAATTVRVIDDTTALTSLSLTSSPAAARHSSLLPSSQTVAIAAPPPTNISHFNTTASSSFGTFVASLSTSAQQQQPQTRPLSSSRRSHTLSGGASNQRTLSFAPSKDGTLSTAALPSLTNSISSNQTTSVPLSSSAMDITSSHTNEQHN